MKIDHYNTDHLSVDELHAVCTAVWSQYMQAIKDENQGAGDLAASPEELVEEYNFWIESYKERVQNAAEAENDTGKTSARFAGEATEDLSFMPWTAYWPG